MRLIYLFSLVFTQFVFGGQQIQAQYKDLVKGQVEHIPGWCSVAKAEAMMDLIFEVRPETCVELGVFAGASLFPTTQALKCLGRGTLYAIDAWDNREAIKYYPEQSPHWVWWKEQNMSILYNECLRMVRKHKLEPYCVILQQSFAEALAQIPSIDILHIDGSHSDEGDWVDAIPYIKKVRKGGYIWFDGWTTSFTTYEHLKKICVIKKVVNSGSCILLQKTKDDEK